MRIPFLDLRRAYRELEAEMTAALAQVLEGGVYILGEEVEAFEEEWAQFCEVAGAAGVGNGTDALALALLASGAIRPGRGDEVITTPLTAAYTALAIVNAGGVPVFADIDPVTYTLDAGALERAITPRTRAVLPVHLYGQMADVAAIGQLAERRALLVIEDAAQAHGARRDGKRAGAHGQAAAFSFYPTKNLGAYGDGGAVVSSDATLVARVKTLRQGGHPAALAAGEVGRNSRLDAMQAAVLRVKLTRLEAWTKRRRALARLYDEGLRGTRLALPGEGGLAHVYHVYVVQHPERDRLRAHLAARGIETLIHYPYLLHQQPVFGGGPQHALPVAEGVAGRLLSLPLHPQLEKQEAQAVIEAILEFENGPGTRRG
jgi:dTDP-4-amino-4,6-dideoxygalactose transaminase